jgi:hypothetical protein
MKFWGILHLKALPWQILVVAQTPEVLSQQLPLQASYA